MTGSGLLAGFLTGLVSLGGAFIVVPAIYHGLMLDGLPSHTAFTAAVATSITFVFASSLAAAVTYARKSMIDFRLLALVSISAAIGVWLGIETLLKSDDRIVRYCFGGFIWAMGLYMFLSKRYRWGQGYAGQTPTYGRLNQALLAIIGIGVGFLVAVFGIGGGGVLAPAIALLFRSDMKRAVGTAVGATVLISLYGLGGYVIKGLDDAPILAPNLGWIYLPALVVLIPCALVAAPLGVKVALKMQPSTLTMIVTATMFIIGARFIAM
jgi:hypothetical protein